MFSDRIREVAEREGLTIKDLAKQLNMNQSSLQRYVTGDNKPGYEFFVAMYQHGININWLLSGEGEMYRPKNPLPPTDDPELLFLRSLFSIASPGLQKVMKPLVDKVERDEQQKKQDG